MSDEKQPDQRSEHSAEPPVEPERGPEPRPERSRRSVPLWAIALVVVLVAAGCYALIRFLGSDSVAGECASVSGADEAAAVSIVDCDDDSAAFRVGTRLDDVAASCPEGAYRELPQDGELLCLMPNFRAGECYAADETNQSFKVTGCDSPESIRISRVIEGSTDPTPCPDGNGLGYPEPPTVFCIETPTT